MDKIDEFTLRPLYKLKEHPEDQKAIWEDMSMEKQHGARPADTGSHDVTP